MEVMRLSIYCCHTTNRDYFRISFFVVRDRDIADDLFQETFVKVITKITAGEIFADR